jgi:hypothetical protein
VTRDTYLPVIVVRKVQDLITTHDTPTLAPTTHDGSLFRQPAFFFGFGFGVFDKFLIWKVVSQLLTSRVNVYACYLQPF